MAETKLKTTAAKRTTRKAPAKPAASAQSKLDLNATAILKAEAQITSNALEVEDSFIQHYDNSVIQPEITPEQYYALNEQNNTLNQCISAMEVNIEGTGYDVVRYDGEELSDKDIQPVKIINQFLAEVAPEMSFTTLRRKLRRQSEIAGYGCVEVIRNPKDDIVFLRPLISKSIRLMKLDTAVPTVTSLIRGGVEMKITTLTRERRFVQIVNEKKVYFKEYGSSRDLSKSRGVWSPKGTKLPSEERATEILYTTIHTASNSPYGIPRWLNQLPSVIGSRSAEELNLEYFEAGGIPPLMVFISGGAMAETARKQLEGLLAGKARNKLKGIVADIQSTSGTIDKGGGVKVDVESFGSDRQNDSMFENYDDKCEKRVRASFRLPPLFVGKADDYSYASVFASYTLAEAQIFAPERMEFDEMFNTTVMKEMTKGQYKIKSKPLRVADAETNLKSLELAMNGGAITKKGLIENLNKIGSINLLMLESDEDTVAERFSGSSSADQVRNPNPEAFKDEPATTEETKSTTVSKADLSYLGRIADRQVLNMTSDLDKEEIEELTHTIKRLNPFESNMVNMLVTNKVYASMDNDSEGMNELCDCVSKIKE
jgi:PBSX family phage portal protein